MTTYWLNPKVRKVSKVGWRLPCPQCSNGDRPRGPRGRFIRCIRCHPYMDSVKLYKTLKPVMDKYLGEK